MPRLPNWLKLLAGPCLAVAVYFLVPDVVTGPDGALLQLGSASKLTAGLTAWMVVWWITEAIPLYVTALLPLIVLPLSGYQSMSEIGNSYGHPIVFLALGGFVLGAAIEKWNLHIRLAYFVFRFCGSNPRNIVAGFMFGSAALSMWISNVATAIIMMPVALSILKMVDRENPHFTNFSACLLLSICYSCSIGGIGTLIGTGTNMFFAAYMDTELNRQISFSDWMAIAMPVVVILLPVTWLLMTRFIFYVPNSRDALCVNLDTLIEKRDWNRGSILTLIVFLATALSWTFSTAIRGWPPLENLSDSMIALLALLFLFVTPINSRFDDYLMDWRTAVVRVPWGILLLIGGGLSIASAVSEFGIGEMLGYQFQYFNSFPNTTIIIFAIILMVYLTEISSNVATVTALSPIFAAIAISAEMDPVLLIAPITVAASCAFMLPVATLTNSVIYGSGVIHASQMARAGFYLNLTAIVVLSIWFGVFADLTIL